MADSRPTILYGIAQLDIGGAERQLYELVRHIDRSRYRPLVFSTSTGGIYGDLLLKAGIPLYVFPRRFAYDIGPIWQISSLMQKNHVQILHTFGYYGSLYGRLATMLYRPKIIISSERTQGAWVKHQRPPYSTVDRFLSRRTDCIVANAQSVKDYVFSQKRISLEKIQVIHNGVAQENILSKVSLPQIHKYRKIYGLDGNKPIVGIVARLEAVKDHKTFLQSAAIILETTPHVRFVVVGDGTLRSSLESLVKQLNISEQIIFTGSLEGSELVNMMAMMDIVVLSSKNEGCSNAILEAMVLGKPVVATNVGGNPELVVDSKTGLIVPPEDPMKLAEAVALLLSNRNLCETMGYAARERVEKLFSVEAMVSGIESLYEKLISGSAVQ